MVNERRSLGATGLSVSPLGIGTSPLASMPELYGYEVDAARAVATVHAVFDSPINYLDTANGYGDAERRIGEAITAAGGLPAGFVLATKVDPDPDTGNLSGQRVRRSVEESLARLGLDRLQLVHLHDPERIPFADATAPGGPVDVLAELKSEGVVENIGVAGGPIPLMLRYVRLGVFDAVLTHNRYTLLDRTAEPLFDEAVQRGMGIMNAAPYGGGILAKGPAAQPKYGYLQRGDEIADRVRAMLAACAAYDVPLAAAALQFSLGDKRITSTIVGVSTPERVAQTIRYAERPIPGDLWEELTELSSDQTSLRPGIE